MLALMQSVENQLKQWMLCILYFLMKLWSFLHWTNFLCIKVDTWNR